MKKLSIIIASIFIIIPWMACGDVDQKNEYLKIRDRYYYIDKQQFNEISCTIEVPIMANLIEQMKKQLAHLKDNIEIKEDLSNFTLKYTPDAGLSFSEPKVEIVLINKEGIADLDRFNKGVEMMKNGFKQQVEGVKIAINGLFEGYYYPQIENYKELNIKKENDSFIVTYVIEDKNVTETYVGKTVKVFLNDNNSKLNSIQEYKEISNKKLILNSGSALLTQPMGTTKSNFEIEYQIVENVVFPKTIKSVFEQSIQSLNQKGSFDIHLTNCKLK